MRFTLLFILFAFSADPAHAQLADQERSALGEIFDEVQAVESAVAGRTSTATGRQTCTFATTSTGRFRIIPCARGERPHRTSVHRGHSIL